MPSLPDPLLDVTSASSVAAKGKRKRARDSEGSVDAAGASGASSSANGVAALDEEDNQDKIIPNGALERLNQAQRDQLLDLLSAMDQDHRYLELPVAKPGSQNGTKSLSALLLSNPPPTWTAILLTLDLISDPSTCVPPLTGLAEPASFAGEREAREFATGVKLILDGLRRDRPGQGIVKEPPRKVALYQRLPQTNVHLSGGGGTYFTNAIDAEEDVLAAGNAQLVEIHPSQREKGLIDPSLGESSAVRLRRVMTRPRPKVNGTPVNFFPRSPFSSFAPSHDSSSATLSFSESARLVKAEAFGDDCQSASWGIDLPLTRKRRAIDTSGLTLEKQLAANWQAMDHLQQLQRERIRRGDQLPGEEENAIAHCLAKSITDLISLRPSLSSASVSSTSAVIPSPKQLHALRSLVHSLDSSDVRPGTLEPSRPYALRDNATLLINSRPPQLQPALRPPPATNGALPPLSGPRPYGGLPARPPLPTLGQPPRQAPIFGSSTQIQSAPLFEGTAAPTGTSRSGAQFVPSKSSSALHGLAFSPGPAVAGAITGAASAPIATMGWKPSN